MGALGIVLNAVTLWNTRYTDAVVTERRAQGHVVSEQDAARLSPLGHAHVNELGRYAFPTEWAPLAWPFGRAIAALWSVRLKQLSLPMHPLDVSFGMDSDVVHIHDGQDAVVGSAWLRTMRKTGATTYSGQYGTALLPEADRHSVRVVIPLPLGSLAVFLTPHADADGGLQLRSPISTFSSDGAYLVLRRRGGMLNARRIPVAEHFHLYVDRDGNVRTDHSLRLWNIPAVRLHYRLTRMVEEKIMAVEPAGAAGCP